MARVKKLLLRDFRLFPEVEKTFTPGLNLVLGGNGTGKTSILESIYLAGRGKTFRHHQSKPLIREGTTSSVVVVHTEDPEGVIGVELNKSETRIRVDSKDLKRRSELLHRFPIQLLNPQSHLLVESGPKARRIFLDFGLFHVEPSFHRLLSDFEKLLRQRNAGLAAGKASFRAFDPQLIDQGERLASLRSMYGERLASELGEILRDLLPTIVVRLRQRTGWQMKKTFGQALDAAVETDQRLGYTSIGPQRGGMEIWTEAGPASVVLSRGQQKLLVLSMVLAQARIMHRGTDNSPLLLIDDVSAELDRLNRQRVVEYLASSQFQVVMTNTDIEEAWSANLSNTFHVEQSVLP